MGACWAKMTLLFTDYEFIIFLVSACLIFWTLRKFLQIQNLWLLGISYFFYAYGNIYLLFIILGDTVLNFFSGILISTTNQVKRRKSILILSIVLNLSFLGIFKYYNFFGEVFIKLINIIGLQITFTAVHFIFPIGISFFIFHVISYNIDIFNTKCTATRNFIDFALYVAFFPQLVAGPIVRAFDFLPQCLKPRKVTGREMAWGLTLFTLGMFEKVAVADGLLAPVAEAVYEMRSYPDFISSWCGTLAFACQIFCDFAGYSISAIGVAKCLGFNLPNNFRFPYAATGFSDFWRRWHISLSSWLRDYLYIPLGGNRKGALQTRINLMLTMLIGGLWHGASWTFVAWGGLHGLYLIMERLARKWVPASEIWRKVPAKISLGLVTFIMVSFAWVFFRSETFEQAFLMSKAMLGIGHESPDLRLDSTDIVITLAVCLMILAFHWLMRDFSLEKIAEKIPWWAMSIIIAGMLVAIVILSGEDRAFIYFQF